MQIDRYNQTLYLICVTIVLALLSTSIYADNTTNCGSLYGEWKVDDYRDPQFWKQRHGEKHHLYLVEAYHFNKAKKTLTSNLTLTPFQVRSIRNDLDYTLRRFPNHHLALHYVFELERRNGGTLAEGAAVGKAGFIPSSYCYFNRASRFKPEDDVVYLVYGAHLHKLKKYSEAYEMYKKSETLNPDSVELAYNLGLLLTDQGNYSEAKNYATFVYERGYQLDGLKNRLAKAGYWP